MAGTEKAAHVRADLCRHHLHRTTGNTGNGLQTQQLVFLYSKPRRNLPTEFGDPLLQEVWMLQM